MKKQGLVFCKNVHLWIFFLLSLFLLSGSGCSLHRSQAPLIQEAVPPLLLEKTGGPSCFKGIGVLTLPANIPPGGSLRLAYTGAREQGLRIAALTPMGAPFFEMVATAKYAQLRDVETGKRHKVSSFTSLSRQALGFPIPLEDLMDLLSDTLPVPHWTKAYTDTANPGIIRLNAGNRLRAKFSQGTGDFLYSMEYFSEGTSLYTITRVSEQPRIWQVEKPGHILLLRIRTLAESPPVSDDLFSLE